MKIKRLAVFLFIMSSSLLASCNKDGKSNQKYFNIHFETCTEIDTNFVADQKVKNGMHAKKPTCIALDDDKQNYVVFDWYTTNTYENVWNFKKDYPTSDMTLYAKWGYEYSVKYYLGDNEKPFKTVVVRDGSFVNEDKSASIGFDYYGSFADKDYSVPFDFSKPITEDTNIYVKKSDGVSLYETNETGSLSSMLTPFKSSETLDKRCVIGDVEPIKMKDGNTYTLANFGATPYFADPYVELAEHIDITKSQILRFKIKNLGNAFRFGIYFTAMMDPDKNVYSSTGRFYSEKFSKFYSLTDEQRNMNKDDDNWLTFDFDLTEVGIANGYSAWGSAKYLGAIRIQSSYISKDINDFSNEIIIKSIEGIYKGYKVEDTDKINNLLEDDDEDVVSDISDLQKENNGFIFPKNYDLVSENSSYARTYVKEDGLLMYTDNEMIHFGTDYIRSMITINKPLDENGEPINPTDLAENCTLNIELQNYGYQDQLTLYLHNSLGDLVVANLNIETRMNKANTYSINLYKYEEMSTSLTSVDILYSSLGVDNALLIKSIYFTSFERDDVPGINFSDKYVLGFSSTSDIDVSYNRSRYMTKFDVKNASEIETTLNYKLSNELYQFANLSFVSLNSSHHDFIDVALYINGEYKNYSFEIDKSISGKAQVVTLPLEDMDKGVIEKVKFNFRGTGVIYMNKLTFSLDENDEHYLSFNHDYAHYMESPDWLIGSMRQDEVMECSILYPNSNQQILWRLHIGYIAYHSDCDFLKGGISLEGKSKVKLIYWNPNNEGKLHFSYSISANKYGAGDEGYGTMFNDFTVPQCDKYEWEVLELDIPETFTPYYLTKMEIGFNQGTLYVRALIVE